MWPWIRLAKLVLRGETAGGQGGHCLPTRSASICPVICVFLSNLYLSLSVFYLGSLSCNLISLKPGKCINSLLYAKRMNFLTSAWIRVRGQWVKCVMICGSGLGLARSTQLDSIFVQKRESLLLNGLCFTTCLWFETLPSLDKLCFGLFSLKPVRIFSSLFL